VNGGLLPIANVSAAAFSSIAGIVGIPGSLNVVSTDGKVLASYATSEAHPVLGIGTTIQSPVAWLPSEEKFVRFTGRDLVATPFSAAQLPGPVKAIAASDSSVDVWALIGDTTVQHLRIAPSGNVTPLELVQAAPNFTEMSGLLVFLNADGLQIQGPTASPQTLPLPFSDLSFEKAAPGWLHITSLTARRQWMLQISQGRATLSELPAFRSTLEVRQ
jgi:hypothetical protein